jgi:hypothetical protein
MSMASCMVTDPTAAPLQAAITGFRLSKMAGEQAPAVALAPSRRAATAGRRRCGVVVEGLPPPVGPAQKPRRPGDDHRAHRVVGVSGRRTRRSCPSSSGC